MNGLCRQIAAWLRSEDALAATEYAVMLVIVVLSCVVAVTTMGTTINTLFGDFATNLRGM